MPLKKKAVGNTDFDHQSFVDCVLAVVPDANIILRLQKIQKGSPTELIETVLYGKAYILEKLHLFDNEPPLSFRIGPSSFFQPNTLQAEVIYREGMKLLALSKDSIVYDLYSGTGTLGMCAARKAGEVIGIELCPKAVKDAEENISLNGISNFTMHQGDTGKVLTLLQGPHPDAVIVDPPRAGLDPLALSHLKRLKPKKILYISCNPRTQAPNCLELMQAGYQIEALQPIDQFPHTAHIENIVLLILK